MPILSELPVNTLNFQLIVAGLSAGVLLAPIAVGFSLIMSVSDVLAPGPWRSVPRRRLRHDLPLLVVERDDPRT